MINIFSLDLAKNLISSFVGFVYIGVKAYRVFSVVSQKARFQLYRLCPGKKTVSESVEFKMTRNI